MAVLIFSILFSRDVTKISSCQVKTTSRGGNKTAKDFFRFYFSSIDLCHVATFCFRRFKKLCLCMASLVLSTRLAMLNLLRQNGHCMTKVNFPMKVAGGMFVVVAGGNALPLPLKFYDSPDSLMTLSVIIAFLSIRKYGSFNTIVLHL